MIRKMTAEDLHHLVQEGLRDAELPEGIAHVIDVRDADDFVAGHVPGARHVPTHQVMRWIPQWIEPYQLVVLVDATGSREGAARHTAGELAHQWFRRLRYLEGGMDSWNASGLPVESGGAAGNAAASECGRRTEYHRSGEVPWVTSRRPLAPDPARVKYADASSTSETP